MKPITTVDIWNLIHPYIGDCPPAYTSVSLNFDGKAKSQIMVLSDPPKVVDLTKTQVERMWRKLAQHMNLPREGVKKASFELAGMGVSTPTVSIEMKPVAKPTERVRKMALYKQEGESVNVLGEQTLQFRMEDSRLVVVYVDPENPREQAMEQLAQHFAELGGGVVMVALPKDDKLEMYHFEEVEER